METLIFFLLLSLYNEETNLFEGLSNNASVQML